MVAETPIGKFIGQDALKDNHEETRKNIEKSNKDAKITINKDSKPEVKVTVSKKWIEKAGLSEKGGLAAIRNFLKEQTKHDTSSDDGFVKAITEYQEKHKKDKKLTADGILGWKTLEVMEQEMEGEKYQDKYQGDNPEMDSEHVLTQAEYDAKNDERAEKLAELGDKAKNITQSKFKVSEIDADGKSIRYNAELKAWVGSEGDNEGKVLNTDTGKYDTTEVDMLATNKTKSEKEATGKKVEELVVNIQSAAAAGDTQDYIQGYLNEIPEDGLSEKQLADLNSSLKEKGLQIETTVDFNTNNAGYKLQGTEFGPRQAYEDRMAEVKAIKVNNEEGNEKKIVGTMKIGELETEIKKVWANQTDVKSSLEQIKELYSNATEEQKTALKDKTINDFVELAKDSNKAALALAPTDKAGVLLGNLGEWGVKYQKKAATLDGKETPVQTFVYREGKAPLVINSDGKEQPLAATFTVPGAYKLPNGDIFQITNDPTTGMISAYKKDTFEGPYVAKVGKNGELETIKTV